jgi:hypothetical protein
MKKPLIPAKYPCLDRSLINLQGERWKYVPGSDTNYKLSNYGRLMGVPRYVEFSDGRAKWTKEKILKLSISTRFNPLVKKYYYDVRGVFNCNGQRFSFGVGRMVYHLFKKPINFSDDAMMVCHKDDNDLNNHVSNLILLSCADKQKLSFKRKRQTSHLRVLEYSIRLKTLRAKAKPVIQYNRMGKKIAGFKSLVEAASKTGCSAGNISSVASGKITHTKGFIWKYS